MSAIFLSAAIGTGIANADPTAAIAVSWGVSALLLGGLCAYALIRAKAKS